MTDTTKTSTFDEAIAAFGWERAGPTEQLRLISGISTGVTFRKGHVRLEFFSGVLGIDHKDRVYVYDNHGQKRSMILSAMLVDDGHRGVGLGHNALLDVIKLQNTLLWDELWVEAIRIHQGDSRAKLGGMKQGKTFMDELALRYWYKRHGFDPYPRDRYGRVMVRGLRD